MAAAVLGCNRRGNPLNGPTGEPAVLAHYPGGKLGASLKQIARFTLVSTAVATLTLLAGAIVQGVREGWSGFFDAIWVCPFVAMFGLMIAARQLNTFPEVWTTEDGLLVAFPGFGRRLIRWADVLEIRHSYFGMERFEVYARRVTPFHQVMYGGMIRPVFWVDPTTPGLSELLAIIRQKAHLRERDYAFVFWDRVIMTFFPLIVVTVLCTVTVAFIEVLGLGR